MESHIFQYCPREDLEAVLGGLHALSGLRVQLLDALGTPLLSYGGAFAYCDAAIKCLPTGGKCAEEHRKAMARAISLGEAYIFCCHTGLYHIVQPLLIRGRPFGSVLAGPFLMDGADEDLIRRLAAAAPDPGEKLLELSRCVREVPSLAPEQALHLSRLLFYLVYSLVSGSRELSDARRARLLHQSRVNESIQKYKAQGQKERSYPLELENRLLSCVRVGSLEEAKRVYHELYARLVVYEKYRLEPLRLRLMELCALLRQAAVERGADTALVLELSQKVMQDLQRAESLQSLSYIVLDNLDLYTESLLFASRQNSRAIREATEYVQSHFAEPVSLGAVAQMLNISPNYLSMLFRRITGRSFREYLNMVRIEQAKRLLNGTDYPIVDIAVACGFSDQSYFTKVFRKYTGLSPKQFR